MDTDPHRRQRDCDQDLEAALGGLSDAGRHQPWRLDVQVRTCRAVVRSCGSTPLLIVVRFNIANVPPPSKHLLALASSSSLPPPSASARAAVAQSAPVHSQSPSQPSPSATTPYSAASFKDYTPNNYNGTQEPRRRNADQRAAALRADTLLEEVEPNRVLCKMCRKWVQLRQDSTYCAYPWIQHRSKCQKKQ